MNFPNKKYELVYREIEKHGYYFDGVVIYLKQKNGTPCGYDKHSLNHVVKFLYNRIAKKHCQL